MGQNVPLAAGSPAGPGRGERRDRRHLPRSARLRGARAAGRGRPTNGGEQGRAAGRGLAPPRHERAGRAGAAGAATAARLRFSNAGCAGRRLAGTRGGLWCEGRSWRLLSERRRSAWSLRGAVSAPRRAAGPGSSGCRGAAGGGAVSVAPLPSAARWCASLRCGEAPGAAPEARGLLRGDEARPEPGGTARPGCGRWRSAAPVSDAGGPGAEELSGRQGELGPGVQRRVRAPLGLRSYCPPRRALASSRWARSTGVRQRGPRRAERLSPQ